MSTSTTVGQLIAKLKKCPHDALLEDSPGERIGMVWVQESQGRVMIGGDVDRPQTLAPGWEEVK